MSKAILIGNGPSALEEEMGKRIDSNEFDVVCRFNRGYKQDDGKENIGFDKFIGTRCDYWITSDLRIKLAMERSKELSGIYIVTPNQTHGPINTIMSIKVVLSFIFTYPCFMIV